MDQGSHYSIPAIGFIWAVGWIWKSIVQSKAVSRTPRQWCAEEFANIRKKPKVLNHYEETSPEFVSTSGGSTKLGRNFQISRSLVLIVGLCLLVGGCGTKSYFDQNVREYRTCADGWQSSSIGIQGACSHHGGVVTKTDDKRSSTETVNSNISLLTFLVGIAVLSLSSTFPGKDEIPNEAEMTGRKAIRSWILMALLTVTALSSSIAGIYQYQRLDIETQSKELLRRQADEATVREKNRIASELSTQTTLAKPKKLDSLQWEKSSFGSEVGADCWIKFEDHRLKIKIEVSHPELLNRFGPVSRVKFIDKDGFDVCQSNNGQVTVIGGEDSKMDYQDSRAIDQADYQKIASWTCSLRKLSTLP